MSIRTTKKSKGSNLFRFEFIRVNKYYSGFWHESRLHHTAIIVRNAKVKDYVAKHYLMTNQARTNFYSKSGQLHNYLICPSNVQAQSSGNRFASRLFPGLYKEIKDFIESTHSGKNDY